MVEGFFGGGGVEDYCELLTSTAECPSIASDFRQPGRNHTQNLVSDVVAISVVEFLEMVDIDNGDRILMIKRMQRLVEGAASANAGEFVMVSEDVRSFDERRGEYESCRGDISVGRSAHRSELEP